MKLNMSTHLVFWHIQHVGSMGRLRKGIYRDWERQQLLSGTRVTDPKGGGVVPTAPMCVVGAILAPPGMTFHLPKRKKGWNIYICIMVFPINESMARSLRLRAIASGG
jgi:hypothetical protein